MDNYNYPLGADNSDAPWNEKVNSEISRDCYVTETIGRKVTLSTTDYIEEEDWNDEFGKCSFCDTSETDWNEAYDSEWSALELIEKLKEYVEMDLINASNKASKVYLRRLLKACQGWEQIECEIEEE